MQEKIKYTFKESTKFTHYTNSVKVKSDDNFLLTNTHVPPRPPPGERSPPPSGEWFEKVFQFET